ncbi:MAG: WYL domain-containing protein [Rhodospirillaceae bacterium]
MAETALLAPVSELVEPIVIGSGEPRVAVRERRKVHFNYLDAENKATERDVRPLAMAFFGPVWILAAWCELRRDFRSFRLDRMADLVVPDETFEPEPDKSIESFLTSGWVKKTFAP